MTKFIYAYVDDDSGVPEIRSIMAKDYEDAQDRLIEKYFNKYDDLEDGSDYSEFTNELFDKHGINLSEIYDIEAL